MDMTARTKLRDFLAGLLARKGDPMPFGDSESLIDSGRLDSLAAVEIVSFLEAEFGVDFADVDFDMARLDSLHQIMAMIDHTVAATA